MRLTDLYVQHFKGFESLELHLNGKSTVLFGVNGAGKSTVLSAINYLLWPVINRLNNAQSTSFRSLNADVVHAGYKDMNLAAELDMNGKHFALQKNYIKAQPGKRPVSVTQKDYDSIVKEFVAAYLPEDEPHNMPVFVNYGTNRSVLDIPLRIRNRHEFSQLGALERASESNLDFRTFFEWFRNQEDLENEMKAESRNLDYKDASLTCVRTAVCAMLDGVSDLRVRRNPLRMTVQKNGLEIRVDNLSDGEKCTLALFGDLARRIAMANPKRENPLEGEGLVLINEIELHMHPSWQRKILGTLRSTFPNIQFIITTHSPQVLSEADNSYNLFGLQQTADNVIVEPYKVYGWDSNGILHAVMDTPSRPTSVEQTFQAFNDALDNGRLHEARRILEALRQIVAPDDPELTACTIALDLEQR